ncbi:MAG: NPCBM/NEW2 domain-containing protein [Acidimicrobiales bacterium]
MKANGGFVELDRVLRFQGPTTNIGLRGIDDLPETAWLRVFDTAGRGTHFNEIGTDVWTSRDLSSVQVVLAGKYERFDATVGLADQSYSLGALRFTITDMATGTELYRGEFSFGDLDEISIDVTGILRLELKAQEMQDSVSNDAEWRYLAMESPTFHRQ